MIRVACLLLLAARALPAPATTPHTAAARTLLHHDDTPGDLLIRTLSIRNALGESSDIDHVNRKQFIVKLLCRKDDHCTHTQVYEFDLLRAEPSVNGRGVGQ